MAARGSFVSRSRPLIGGGGMEAQVYGLRRCKFQEISYRYLSRHDSQYH